MLFSFMGIGINRTKFRIKYFLQEATGKKPRFGLGYHEWQSKRIIAMLDHYGHPFFTGKKIIELGAGYGDIGGFFSKIGANVVCLEGRESNRKKIADRYPATTAILHDCNNPIPPAAGKADFIIHFGVLYHLRDPEASLRDCCRRASEMVLETECADSSDPTFFRQTSEKSWVKDHALDGVGCSPSPAFIERILGDEGMKFIRIDDDRCNAEGHFYDWSINNTGITQKGQRKFWFVKRKQVSSTITTASVSVASLTRLGKHSGHPAILNAASLHAP